MSTKKTFICLTCNKAFKDNCDLTRHLNKKKPCSEEVENTNKACVCEYCEHSFSRPCRKDKHVLKCYMCPANEEFDCYRKEVTKQVFDLTGKLDKLRNKIAFHDSDVALVKKANVEIDELNKKKMPLDIILKRINKLRREYNVDN